MRGLVCLTQVLICVSLLVCITQSASTSMAQEDTGQTGNSDINLSADNNNVGESEPVKINTQDDWSITIIPYLWMLAIDGDVAVKGTKSPISVNFGDVLDNLNFAFMGEVRVRKGRIGGYFDSIFGLLETNRKTVQTSNGPAKVKVKVKVDMVILEGGLFYRIIDTKMGNTGSGAKTNIKLDLIAGGRWTYLETKLDIKSSPNVKGDKNFFDPIVGFTSVFDFPHKINFSTHGDLGGFSVGSEFTWQLWATLGYRFGLFGDDNANVLVGYRALSQDYKDGSGENRFRWDVIIHGPIIGLAIDL